MPLIKCDECLGEVSDRAFECPQCGVPIRDRPKPKDKDGWEGLGLFLIACIASYLVVGDIVACAMTSEDATPLKTELAGALRPSQEIVNSSHEIDEGQYFVQRFELYTTARVRLQLNASPEPVDVMLMTPADLEEYREASEGGGSYNYRGVLSANQVLRFDKTETLSQGEWAIVIERHSENTLSPQSTDFDITVTLH